LAKVSISLKGIDQAITNLNYRKNSIKQRILLSIRAHYLSENSIADLESINTDNIVKSVWDTGNNPIKIRAKRRNFSSVKSSINTDLKRLSQNNRNPENITINPANIFDMSEDAKNDLLKSFSNAVKTGEVDLNQVSELLKVVTDFLSDTHDISGNSTFQDIVSQVKEIISKVSENMIPDTEKINQKKGDITDQNDDSKRYNGDESDEPEGTIPEDEIEEIELDEDEDLEDVELDEDEDIEEVDLDEDEIEALENYRKEKELAEHFDEFLGENDKKYNAYVIVPAGTYTVGSKRNFKNTLQLQEIYMPEIYIAQYPVTNSLFEVFVEQTGYITLAEKKGFGTVFHGRFKKGKKISLWKRTSGSAMIAGACWYQPQGPGSTLHGKKYHPVVQISIDDAWAFASWIGRRLPSEAEWEACARTDMGFRYPWGNEWKDGCCNIEKSSFSDTTPVDRYDNYANGFKVVDLLGNVMEWTSDREPAPFDSDNAIMFNIAKGGGWVAKDDITITSRSLFKQGFASNITGFRCISKKFL